MSSHPRPCDHRCHCSLVVVIVAAWSSSSRRPHCRVILAMSSSLQCRDHVLVIASSLPSSSPCPRHCIVLAVLAAMSLLSHHPRPRVVLVVVLAMSSSSQCCVHVLIVIVASSLRCRQGEVKALSSSTSSSPCVVATLCHRILVVVMGAGLHRHRCRVVVVSRRVSEVRRRHHEGRGCAGR